MKSPKILLFDLDGTLLRDDKTLSEYTLQTLSKCRKRGRDKPLYCIRKRAMRHGL